MMKIKRGLEHRNPNNVKDVEQYISHAVEADTFGRAPWLLRNLVVKAIQEGQSNVSQKKKVTKHLTRKQKISWKTGLIKLQNTKLLKLKKKAIENYLINKRNQKYQSSKTKRRKSKNPNNKTSNDKRWYNIKQKRNNKEYWGVQCRVAFQQVRYSTKQFFIPENYPWWL